MKKLIIFMLVLSLMLIAFSVIPTKGQPDNFIIDRADDSANLTFTSSTELETLIANLLPRFTIRFADNNLDYDIFPITPELQSLIDNIDKKFTIRFANSNQDLPFAYPLNLIGDTIPPQLENVSSRMSGASSIVITWETNEFATSKIDYGVQSGSYAESMNDNYYRKQHEMVIANLSIGTTYYFRITNTDRSGNVTQSTEYSITTTSPIYLPLVIR